MRRSEARMNLGVGIAEMNEATYERLLKRAQDRFRCGPHSIHGPKHWRNVESTILLIAPQTGADVDIGRLFAIFHDCCRLDDGGDADHGPRAAAFLQELIGSERILSAPQADALIYAVHHHTFGMISDDPTIGSCWDADRLDLGRVGIVPSAKMMSTSAGKEIAALGTKYLYRK
jgi:uncharacterized protein